MSEGSWLPFVTHKRMQDLEVLAGLAPFAVLAAQEQAGLSELIELADFAPGATLLGVGEEAPGMLIVMSGQARLYDHAGCKDFGVGEILEGRHLVARAASPHAVFAVSQLRVARLLRGRFDNFANAHPVAALHFVRELWRAADVASSDDPTLSLGRKLVRQCVPTEVDGALVVAARLGGATLSLTESTPGPSTLSPVTVRDWEGREIYRRSAALVCLEAASRHGLTGISMGPSWTSGRLILGIDPHLELISLAIALTQEIERLVAAAQPLEEIFLTLDEAKSALLAAGHADASALLSGSTSRRVALCRFGRTLAISPGPLVPDSGFLRNLVVFPNHDGLGLDFGDRVRGELVKRPVSTMMIEQATPRYGAEMTNMKRGWLEQLGVTSVGSFNRKCISGEVNHVIDVAEGYQEKRIAQLADRIRDREGVRIVAVAGPSSSGKTTFLRRLKIQLQVNGLKPYGLELDNYYVDRERNVRDASGEYDFEAVEALDLQLLARHTELLLAEQTVKTARYDFVTGKSHPDGGVELALPKEGVLLVEGIHALNPRLFAQASDDCLFRVFIHPATALPFDALSTLEPSDVRLLRRIVRDRHGRGTSAEQNLARWPSVRRGERLHIDPHRPQADYVFDSSLVYEVSVLKVFAERYLLEVPADSPQFPGATRLRRLIAPFIPIYPDRVPPTSIIREFIGGGGFRH